MITFVRGTLFSFDAEKVVLDTGAVGYEIYVPTYVLSSLPPLHTEMLLYTYHSVKEDDETLYGFTEEESLRMFRLLLSVSGVGPKGAMGILSFLTVEALRMAILSEDAKTLSKAPGIGAKTAGRILLELRDKVVKTVGENGIESGMHTITPPAHVNREEAVFGLVSLGFTASEATKAVARVPADITETADILKKALSLIKS